MIVPSRSPLNQLLRVTESSAPLIILPHDNPDPDALASAAALRFIVRQAREEKEIIIALGGIVGRAENRAMLRYLNINLAPVGEIDFSVTGQIFSGIGFEVAVDQALVIAVDRAHLAGP